MRDWLVRVLDRVESWVRGLKVATARPTMRKLVAQDAIILCYVCTLCGDRYVIKNRADIDWVHFCAQTPKALA